MPPPISSRPTGHTPSVRAQNEPPAPPPSAPVQPADAFDGSRGSDPAGAMRRMHESLTRSATHPAITDGDCRTAVRELSTLSPNQFQNAIERMNRSGTLETLSNEAPSSVRADFLRLCERNHVITSTRTPAETAPLDPPAGAHQYVNASTLPAPLREMMHERNTEAALHYREAYNQYADRYVDAVHRAQSGAELRALGRQQPPHDISEPGVTAADREYQLDRSEVSQHFRTLDGLTAVSERFAELREEAPPGQVSIQAQGSVRAGISVPIGDTTFRGDATAQGSARVTTRGTTSATGATTHRARLEAAGETSNPNVTVGSTSHGDHTVGGDFGGYGASATYDHQTGDVSSVGVTTPLGGASYDGHRLGLTTPEIGGVQGQAGTDSRSAVVDVRVSANRSAQAEVVGGVVAHARVEGEVRVDTQLLSPTTAYDAIEGDTLERRPVEMEEGRSWASLSPTRQQQLVRANWTEAEWNAGLRR